MILLDTCTLLWLVLEQEKLSKKAKELLDHGTETLHISSISAFEIGTLLKKNRLDLPLPLDAWLEKAQEFLHLQEIP